MPDEDSRYENMPTEDRGGHIYEALVTVREWLGS
jgi:hypothetical protein